jgi:predicted acylesterase/phospholipase RssA
MRALDRARTAGDLELRWPPLKSPPIESPRPYNIFPRTILRRLLVVMLLGSVGAIGCTNKNVALNGEDVPLEARVTNHTRAALSAEVLPLASAPGSPTQDTRPAMRPAKRLTEPPAALDRNGDGCFVGLALSGGGSRSANFSASCMFQLERLGLLDKVDYISSVSGGSLTGAYYCLFDQRYWNPGNVQRRLTHSFATDVFWTVVMPWNYVALLLTDWDRSDVLAEDFETHLFTKGGRGMTFADLRKDRPRLLINATDLQSGRPFIFCNETFDELNSDLSKYPIGWAVAASAAVPVVMHHVTLRDYNTTFKQYRHLIDGGINDNLGITSLVETYRAQTEAARRAGQPPPYPNGAVFFVVDARTRFDAQLSNKGDIGLVESLAYGAGLTSTSLLNRVSSATLSDIIVKYSPDNVTARQLREQMKQLEDTGVLTLDDQQGRPIRVYHLSLSHVNQLANLPFASFSEKVTTISTYFNIEQTEAYQLNVAAELLVRQKYEDEFRELARRLDAMSANHGAAAATTTSTAPVEPSRQ